MSWATRRGTQGTGEGEGHMEGVRGRARPGRPGSRGIHVERVRRGRGEIEARQRRLGLQVRERLGCGPRKEAGGVPGGGGPRGRNQAGGLRPEQRPEEATRPYQQGSPSSWVQEMLGRVAEEEKREVWSPRRGPERPGWRAVTRDPRILFLSRAGDLRPCVIVREGLPKRRTDRRETSRAV